MLVYSGEDLTPVAYTNSNFQLDPNFKKSTFGSVFTLGWGVIILMSVKQSYIVDSNMEPNTWPPAKLLKKLYGSRNSWWIYK